MSIANSIRGQIPPIHREGYPFIGGFALASLILFWIWSPLGWIGTLLTIWCALSYSPLFLLLPGVNGLLVWGNHKWRDLGLAALSLLLFVVGSLVIRLLSEMGLLNGLGLEYARDVVLALAVCPAVKVVIDQYHTIDLRRALQG